MAGFRDTLIDALALVAVAGGLGAAAISYLDGIPQPTVAIALALPEREDPVTTGSIAPRAEDDGGAAAPWSDPPARAAH